MSRVVIGGVVGGVILFCWMLFSWMVLPWHKMVLKTFDNPEQVAHVVEANAIGDGEYLYPFVVCETSECKDRVHQKMKKGPLIFVHYQKKGLDHQNPGLYLISLIEGLVAAYFLCFLLRIAAPLKSYFRRVYFSGIVGFTIGFLAVIPNWTWMGASGAYTFTILANYLVGFLIVGFVISGFVKHRDT